MVVVPCFALGRVCVLCTVLYVMRPANYELVIDRAQSPCPCAPIKNKHCRRVRVRVVGSGQVYVVGWALSDHFKIRKRKTGNGLLDIIISVTDVVEWVLSDHFNKLQCDNTVYEFMCC